ncbi:probable nucleoredoxin 1-2 [Diospyros lotus]|uniref:probable nucleoredoxin 1-2 n=1 Tax=Diospyros lotus TaxID=55363 RepID=UPI00225B08F1|nr:probable nucleoredoxin 1-2 [Diospyros lotus]
MAEDESVLNNNEGFNDLMLLLGGSSSSRDYLVRNTGEKVEIDKLKGKKLGIYFSTSSCFYCRQFTPHLVAVYNELSSKGDFEVIHVSADINAGEYHSYFDKMPWLSIPFSDSEKREELREMFGVEWYPYLVILDENGEVLTAEGVEIIKTFGSEGYPFTPERIEEMKEAALNPSLRSILVSPSRDFVISNHGKKVPVSELEGKVVGLYFFSPSYGPCLEFTPKLLEFYNKLKDMGESIEIVTIGVPGHSEDEDEDEEESFKERVMNMPWHALPWRDGKSMVLAQYFDLHILPALVIVGPDGKIATYNAVEDIEDYGIPAYPFTPEKLSKLAEKEKAGWPQKVKHPLHDEHELVLTFWSSFRCDGCMEIGHRWAFYCKECGFHLHPKCALGEELERKGGGGPTMNKLVKFLQSLLQAFVAVFKKLLRF